MWTAVLGDGCTEWAKKVFVKRKEVVDDSFVFRLHSAFTPLLLTFCSGLLTLEQFGFGTAIACVHNKNGDDNMDKFVDLFCWISSTYTLTSFKNATVGVNAVAPGVSAPHGLPGDRRYYPYYQWVCLVLSLQAGLCYMPKYLWMTWEGGLLKSLVRGLKVRLGHDDHEEEKDRVVHYLTNYRKYHSFYMLRYWICEFLCLVNVVFQMFLMNKFLNGEFFRYGLDFLSFANKNQEDRSDPMIHLFPRVTKCDFHTYGPSGTIQKMDVLCILPLNILNEKTYIFVWFWFAFLLGSLTLLILYRLLICLSPWLRRRLLTSRDSRVAGYHTAIVSQRGTWREYWWMLYRLSMNMDPVIFREVLQEVGKSY